MENFHRIDGVLYCEDVNLAELVVETGTPAYVYSRNSMINSLELFLGAFEKIDLQVSFSVKSNSNIALLQMLGKHGSGADIVSGGELYRALKAGIAPEKIVYSGVGKTEDEIRYAIESGIGMFNIESEPEIYAIASCAERLGKIAPVAFRVNPDVDAKTHHHTTTGKKENKFGVPYYQVIELYMKANGMQHVRPIGIDVHLGSPIYILEPFLQALERLDGLISQLHAQGIDVHALDMGGGYAIVYNDEKPFTPLQFADVITPFVKKHRMRLIIEPGRSIVGNGGILLTKLVYVKRSYDKTFYICDAGMNDLIRPAFYGSFHRIQPVVLPPDAAMIKADIVGPICESSDCFAKDREMPEMAAGEYLAIMSAGAYGFSMSSNYNSRPRACEVLVDGSSHAIIRARESYEDLIRGENLTD